MTSQIPKNETRNTFYWITWEVKIQSGNKILTVYVILQKKKKKKKIVYQKILWKLWPEFSSNPLWKGIWGDLHGEFDKFW